MLHLFAQADAVTRPAAEGLEAVVDVVKTNLGQTIEKTTLSQWLFLLGAILAGVVVGKIAASVLRGIAGRFAGRGWESRAALFSSMAGPANLSLITGGLQVGLVGIFPNMPAPVREFSEHILLFLLLIAVGWFIYNLVDLVEVVLLRFATRTRSGLDDQLVPLVRKTLRIFLIVVFALAIADNVFGVDITAWLAGLGIAGLAVSLAAQDSIRNLFGSITVLFDRPFAVGERVIFEGHDGPIEEIGFRSTKVRTLEGELVTIPNSKFIDGMVRNVARRPNIRRVMDVTITYDTPPEKVEQAIQIIKKILAEPEIAQAWDAEKFPPRVNFNELNADSLNIRVFYWFHPPDYWQYLDHAEKINLKLFRAYAEAGIDFAFPTQTIHLANDEKRQLAVRLMERKENGEVATHAQRRAE